MSPDRVQARKMVLVSAFALAALAVYRDRRQGKDDTFRALWGVGVVSLLLSLLADFAPTIAGPFAALTVLGSLASGDVSIIDRVFGGSPAAPGGSVASSVRGQPVRGDTRTTTPPRGSTDPVGQGHTGTR